MTQARVLTVPVLRGGQILDVEGEVTGLTVGLHVEHEEEKSRDPSGVLILNHCREGVMLLHRDGENLSRENLQGVGAGNQPVFFGCIKVERPRNLSVKWHVQSGAQGRGLTEIYLGSHQPLREFKATTG